MRPLNVAAERLRFGRAIALHVFEPGGGPYGEGPYAMAAPVEFNIIDQKDVDCVFEPTMQLPIDAAQQLMDELWRCGLRPSEGTGSAGALAAVEKHLADMQAIAIALLRKEGADL